MPTPDTRLLRRAPRQERREGEPRIDITFFFAAHGKPEDYARLRELIDQTDVFIPEAYAWNQEGLDFIRAVAKGAKVPRCIQEGRKPKTAFEEELTCLYNSGKLVYFLDIPAEHPITKEDDGSDDLVESRKRFIAGRFDEAIVLRKKGAMAHATSNLHREQYIGSQIETGLPSMITKEDELQNRPAVKVLIALGAYHTRVAHIAESHYDVSKEFSTDEGAYVYTYNGELNRRAAFDKPIDDLLVAKALLEINISLHFRNGVSNDVFTKIIRKILERITDIEQCRRISEACHKQGEADSFEVGFEVVALKRTILEMTGFTLPETPAEMEQLLKQCGIEK